MLLCLIVTPAIAQDESAATRPAVRPVTKSTTQPLPREQWGAALVNVTHDGSTWTITGKKQTLTLNAADLSMRIQAEPVTWSVLPSRDGDLRIKANGKETPLKLTDAKSIDVVPYDVGFKTGVKITLGDYPGSGDLRLFLTLALEGRDEDLAFDVAAVEHDVAVHQLDWPGAIDGRVVDCTILSNHRGVLLPREWPKPYFPIRASNSDGSAKQSDTSEVQSNVIESWSMSFWGWQQGKSAAMVIVETPDDAAYQFDHPAGGPTTIGPRWRESLGQMRYPRAGRMCFFAQGNYVDLAKRYRQHVMDHGGFVSLNEKIARRPIVKELIATPLVRLSILRNIQRDSLMYAATQPARKYQLNTFDERAALLREWKQKGIDRLHVCLTGWPNQGYDRQHPDELPPAQDAGGWDGMKRLAETCKSLGHVLSLHEQYRDYYADAQSFDAQFAIQEEDDSLPATSFPGSRFGQTKVGRIPFMNNWDGGTMAYLNNRFMLGHLIKNWTALHEHGTKPDGIYLDVFGYVPPDEDFNPEHPTTRTQALDARRACYNWSRNNIGFIGTEAACDWTIPYADISSPLTSTKGVPIPLFNLVYHDAIITPYSPTDLRGYLNGGLPQGFSQREMSDQDLANVKRMAALHQRLALTELTEHEFLDEKFRKERTTFSDGTTVTVDWDANSVEIQPDVK